MRSAVRGPALLELRNEKTESVFSLMRRPIPATWFGDPYRVICERYLQERYSPQMVLGEEFELTMGRDWWNYINDLVLPRLIESDDFVRGTLRCLQALPAVNL